MRSFVVFALFALAVCQNPINDVVAGFTTQLAFTEAQTADATTCLNGVFAEIPAFGSLYVDYLAHDIQAFVTDAVTLFQTVEPALQTACQAFINDVETYAVTFGNGNSTKVNFAHNFAYVLQQGALIFQNLANKNATGLGQTIGYLYQIGVGSVDLEVIAPEQLTYEQAMTLQKNLMGLMSDSASLTQIIQAYVDGVGMTEQVDVAALVKLIQDLPHFVANVMILESSLKNGTFDSDITAIETFITATLELIRAHEAGFKAEFAMDAPIYKALLSKPIKFIAQSYYNAALNAPKVIQLENQMLNDLIAANYAAVGADVAELAKTYYGQIYAN